MSIFKNSIIDSRVREYLPTIRVMLHDGVEKFEKLLNCKVIQVEFAEHKTYCKMGKNSTLLLDFGIELNGGIRIVNAKTKSKIRVRFGESVSEAMNEPNQDHAIHDAIVDVAGMGVTEYGNTGFRFVRIDTFEEELKLVNIVAVALYNDLERVGSFLCSDERINKIYEACIHTIQLNIQDYIYDGIKRDRLVWMGDLHPEIRCILSTFSDTSSIMKSLDFVRDNTQIPNVMNNIETYSIWWVINQYEYYLHTGNLEYLKEQKEYLTNLMELLCSWITEDGIEQITGRRFLDWPNNDNKVALHAGLQGLLFWGLDTGIKLYKALNINSLILEKHYNKMSKYNPDCGNSKSAAAILTVSNLTNKNDILTDDIYKGISTFYGYYILLALENIDDALNVIRKYWGAMLDYGATTFWEDFDLDWLKNASPITEFVPEGKDDLHADFGAYCYKGLRHSLCHGWASGPAPYLIEKVLGIKFLTPAGNKISIKPQLGNLEFVKGSVPTIYGKVEVYADKSGNLDIKTPKEIEVV